MLKTLQNAFKVKDVRHRIFYVLMMLVVIRIGSQLPVPGVDGSYFKTWFESQTGDAFNFHLTSHHPLLSSFLQSRFQNWKKCRETEKMAERNLVQLPVM